MPLCHLLLQVFLYQSQHTWGKALKHAPVVLLDLAEFWFKKKQKSHQTPTLDSNGKEKNQKPNQTEIVLISADQAGADRTG